MSESTDPDRHFSMSRVGRPHRSRSLPTTPGDVQPFSKASAWHTDNNWESSLLVIVKMQHRIKGYMLVHVTHNKVSRIFTSIVVRIDLLSNQICIDKSQRKRKRITAIIRIIMYRFEKSF